MKDSLRKHPALEQSLKEIRKKKADHFEVFFSRSTSTQIDARDGKIDTLSRDQDIALALRIIKDERPGFSFTTSLDPSSVKQTIQRAFEIAAVMEKDPHASLNHFGKVVYPKTDSADFTGLKKPMDEKIAMAKRLEEICRGCDPRVVNVRNSEISETHSEVLMIDTEGEIIFDEATLYGATVVCKAAQGDDHQMGYDFQSTHVFERLDLETVAKRAAGMSTQLLGATAAPTMTCPAVLRNYVVSQLLSFISSSFSAESIDKGKSMLARHMGKKVFNPHVTIMDDGLLTDGYGTRSFDAEGVPKQQTMVIDQGSFATALYDRYYAHKSKKKSTGSAIRSMTSPPSVGFSNLYLEEGKNTFDQLLTGIKKGIYITDLMGVHTANPVTGDFSLGASGILIEKGQLTQPVKGFAVAGNILELFRRMTDISNDIRFFGKVGAPSVRVSSIAVGGQ